MPNEIKPHYFDDAFLVIADKPAIVNTSCGSEAAFIREYLDEPSAGTHFTPDLVIDDNLIISVSTRNGKAIDKAKRLHKKLANQFENNGYGAFIEFLERVALRFSRLCQRLKNAPTSLKGSSTLLKIRYRVTNPSYNLLSRSHKP